MRIITYKDPRYLDKIKGWDEIKKYPNLCISQTLVQGLSQRYGRVEFTTLCTINNFLKELYSELYNNPKLEMEQYLDLVHEINQLDIKVRRAFKKNKIEVYNSIKILCEAGIEENDFEVYDNNEIKILIDLYNKCKKKSSWKYYKHIEDKNIESFRNACLETVSNDLILELNNYDDSKDYKNMSKEELLTHCEVFREFLEKKSRTEEKSLRVKKRIRSNKIIEDRLNHYANIISNPNNLECSKIVLIGIHQFTAPILRLIRHMEELGIEPIFLINYNENFDKIYSTWDKVYKWTGKQFEIDDNKIDIKHSYLSEGFLNIVEGNLNNLPDIINKISNVNLFKFDNLSSFANYVSEVYEEAEGRSSKNNSSEILAKMNEQFYSVDGEEVNNLLKVYFPNQFGERHFLAYPIGQFILGIFNMWDEKEAKLILKENDLKACLSVNLWSNEPNKSPLSLYEKVSLYFSDIKDIKCFLERLEVLESNIVKVSNKNEKKYDDIKELSYFNISIEELKYLQLIIKDIDNIATKIFNNNDKRKNIKSYYLPLIEEISNRDDKNNGLSDEESEFVREIKDKLEINDDNLSGNHAMEEIKELLHYYLSINNNDRKSNWIVRDFEQLDGAVLLADPNCKEGWEKNSIYHYAELSNVNMKNINKRNLPWPLERDVFNKHNSTIEIIMNSKEEYNNFLRYNLFYGLYFFDGELNISYIEDKDNNEDLYYLIKILNLEEKLPYLEKDIIGGEENQKDDSNEIIMIDLISDNDVHNFSFCKYRYLFECILDKKSVYNNDFIIKQYLKVSIAIKYITNIKSPIKEDELEKHIDIYLKGLMNLIPYLKKEVDIPDLKVGILSHIKRWSNLQGDRYSFKQDTVNDYEYHKILRNFIYRSFSDEETTEIIEKYTSRNKENIRKEIIEFIKENDKVKNNVVSMKCDCCKYKEICVNNI